MEKNRRRKFLRLILSAGWDKAGIRLEYGLPLNILPTLEVGVGGTIGSRQVHGGISSLNDKNDRSEVCTPTPSTGCGVHSSSGFSG